MAFASPRRGRTTVAPLPSVSTSPYLATNPSRPTESDRFSALRETFLAALGPRGGTAPVTAMQAAVAISGFLMYDDNGALLVPSTARSLTARALAASSLIGRSNKATLRLWRNFEEQGRIIIEQPGTRGPRRPNEAQLLALEPLVIKHVEGELRIKDVPSWVTRRSLIAFISETTGIKVGLNTVSRLIKAWGLEYSRLRRPPAAVTAKRVLQRDVAVCQLFELMQRRCYIVCADESYCNERENREYSLHPAKLPFATFARATGSGLGRRLCFIHAICEGGLAGMPDDLVGVVGNVDSAQPHCEMMFTAQESAGDYHGNFDHVVFMKWVMNRFIPWARAAHPELAQGAQGALTRKLVLMLDNAPYHTGSTETLVPLPGLRFNPLSTSKKALLCGMALAGCALLKVKHTYTPVGSVHPVCTIVSVPISDAGLARHRQDHPDPRPRGQPGAGRLDGARE